MLCASECVRRCKHRVVQLNWKFMSNSLISNLAPLNSDECVGVCARVCVFAFWFCVVVVRKSFNAYYKFYSTQDPIHLNFERKIVTTITPHLSSWLTHSITHSLIFSVFVAELIWCYLELIKDACVVHVKERGSKKKKTHSLANTCRLHAHTLNKLIENRFLLSMNSKCTQTWQRTEESEAHSKQFDFTLFVNWIASIKIHRALAEESAFQLCTIHFQYQCNISSLHLFTYCFSMHWAVLCFAHGINDESFNFNCSLIELHAYRFYEEAAAAAKATTAINKFATWLDFGSK